MAAGIGCTELKAAGVLLAAHALAIGELKMRNSTIIFMFNKSRNFTGILVNFFLAISFVNNFA